MTLYVLSVEDQDTVRDQITEIVQHCSRDIRLTFAESQEEALGLLAESFFDLVLLDLKIPVRRGELDTAVDHGLYVLAHIKDRLPGVSVAILTGSPSEELIDGLLKGGHTVDVWGTGAEWTTIRFFKKSRIAELPKLLVDICDRLDEIERLECRDDGGVNLPLSSDRLIRIIVRQRGGTSYELVSVNDGASGAAVFKLRVLNDNGVKVGSLVAKIASRDDVVLEEHNYSRYADRLVPEATPRFLHATKFGAGAYAAAVYTLAEGFTRDMFILADKAKEDVDAAVGRLAAHLRPWSEGVHERSVLVGDIRRTALANEKLEGIIGRYSLGWVSNLEKLKVQSRWCPTHGDLHGGNVLVDGEARPQFIDYNDIREGPPSFDWVTLELSLIFALKGPARKTEWPSRADCAAWGDATAFSSNGPFRHFVEACRASAMAVAPGKREVAASAYAYVLRQLKYEDTDKEIAVALLNAIRPIVEGRQ